MYLNVLFNKINNSSSSSNNNNKAITATEYSMTTAPTRIANNVFALLKILQKKKKIFF